MWFVLLVQLSHILVLNKPPTRQHRGVLISISALGVPWKVPGKPMTTPSGKVFLFKKHADPAAPNAVPEPQKKCSGSSRVHLMLCCGNAHTCAQECRQVAQTTTEAPGAEKEKQRTSEQP